MKSTDPVLGEGPCPRSTEFPIERFRDHTVKSLAIEEQCVAAWNYFHYLLQVEAANTAQCDTHTHTHKHTARCRPGQGTVLTEARAQHGSPSFLIFSSVFMFRMV